MKNTLLLILLLLPILAISQEIIPDMVTDRPDQTESSSVVPLKYLQIETGFVMTSNETDFAKNKFFALNTTLLRYGLSRNFELRLGLEYLQEKHEFKSHDSTNTNNGFGPLHLGFKIKINEENGIIPEIAFLGGFNLPFTANTEFKPTNVGANMRFAFNHTLSDRFSIGYNLGARWDGEQASPSYFYSLVLGIGITEKLGMFVESYGLLNSNTFPENMLDAGFTYSIRNNLQVDISGGIGINEDAIDNFISAGLSWRLPH
jgi:hypothetical protein